MTSAPAVPSALPFAELLDDLRRQGFVIGLDQHLRLQRLLDRLAVEGCPPERLKTHLCPIFATSREEQVRFYRAFDRLYPGFGEVDGAAGRRESAEVPATLVQPLPGTPAPRAWWILPLSLILAASLAASLWFWWKSNRREATPVEHVQVGPAPAPLPSPEVDTSLVLDSVTAPPPPEPAEAPPAPEAEPSPLARYSTALRAGIVVLVLGLFLLNEWRLYRRRTLVLSRERRSKPPFTWPVRLEAPTNPFAESADLPTAARLLRQREPGAVARLSVEQSVSATIAALGFPTFRYRTDTRAPDYLLLIERTAYRDHRARLYQALARALEREGVHVTRYVYDRDPRICYSEHGEQRELLVDLRRRFPDYRLLLFSPGEHLVDPVTGRLHPWTAQFLSWNDRALLTPESPAGWGLREVALAQHFVVLPATTAGLMGVVGHFQGPARPDAGRWRELDPSPPLPRLDEGDPVATLRSHLGPRLFRWLCACAVYPELHWDLTLHFGGLPEFGPGLINEENLLRLLRLPWFRQGAIPDDIRARLIDQLSEAEERAVRGAIVELLERNPAPGDSVAANRYELDLVVQRLALHRRNPRERAAVARSLAGFPRRELVQDFAMLRLLEETPANRLQVLLPRRLRKIFYRDGVPALGARAGVRVALTGLVLWAGWSFTGTPRRYDFSPIGPDKTSDGTVVMLVGEETRLVGLWQGHSPRLRKLQDQLDVRAWTIEPDSLAIITLGRESIDTVRLYPGPENAPFTQRTDRLRALAPGVGTIRAKLAGGEQVQWPIRVEPPNFGFPSDLVKLSVGDIRQLKLIVPGQESRDLPSQFVSGLQWTSSDSTVLRVRPDGVVEVVGPGTGTVTVAGYQRSASTGVSVSGGVDAGDQRTAIELVVREYARALAAGNVDEMRAVFPGLNDSLIREYRQRFRAGIRIETSRWRYREVEVKETTARLEMGGATYLIDREGRKYGEVNYPRAIRLERQEGRWRIISIDGQPLLAASDNTGVPSGSATLTRLRTLDSLRLLAQRGEGAARKVYFSAFDSILLQPTQLLIQSRLRSLPADRPRDADYAGIYSLLRAYLTLTAYSRQSSPEFLAPVLTRAWADVTRPDGEALQLAEAQFAFYAAELHRDRSLMVGSTDSLAVQRARTFLVQFKTGELAYLRMLMEASRSGAQPFEFFRSVPNAGRTVIAPYVVPPAFTRKGWLYMQGTAFKRPERYLQGEDWVLGRDAPSGGETSFLVDSLKSRYRREYAEHWRQVLARARVRPFSNMGDAARSMMILGGSPSPLMQLINAVSLNTAMDSQFAAITFQPALVVSPPDSTRLVTDAAREYTAALLELGMALRTLLAAEPAQREKLAGAVRLKLVEVKYKVAALQRTFGETAGSVGPDVARLLSSGFSEIDQLLGQEAPAEQEGPPAVAAVLLSAGTTTLAVGDTTNWVVTIRDALGQDLPARPVAWRSQTPDVAAVSPTGRITAIAPGKTVISVEVDGMAASQQVNVVPAPAPPAPPAVRIPDEAVDLLGRARAYEGRNELFNARESYRDALRVYPEYREASAGLTRVTLKLRVHDWTNHLSQRSLSGLQQMYPEMTEREQEAWRQLLQNPSVTRLGVVPQDIEVELTGEGSATVRYVLVYTVDSRPGGRKVSTSRYQSTFRMIRGAWLITRMQGIP